MNLERLTSIILAPIVSEKATRVADKQRQITFKVVGDATKPEIKQAVEYLFNVKVDGVRVCNIKGKQKVFKQVRGARKNTKKAYVSLMAGHDINFSNAE